MSLIMKSLIKNGNFQNTVLRGDVYSCVKLRNLSGVSPVAFLKNFVK